MHNTHFVHGAEAKNRFEQNTPHLRLLEVEHLALGIVNFQKQVPTVCKLHNNAEVALVKKSFPVADNVWVVETRQNPDLVYCILPVFFAHRKNLHLFHCVELLVKLPFDQEDLRVATAAQGSHNLEVLKGRRTNSILAALPTA